MRVTGMPSPSNVEALTMSTTPSYTLTWEPAPDSAPKRLDDG